METLNHYFHDHNVYDAKGNQVKPDKPAYTASPVTGGYVPVKDQGQVQKAAGDLNGRGDSLAKQIEDAGG